MRIKSRIIFVIIYVLASMVITPFLISWKTDIAFGKKMILFILEFPVAYLIRIESKNYLIMLLINGIVWSLMFDGIIYLKTQIFGNGSE